MAPGERRRFQATDYGRTWQPIFDDQPSVGRAIAVRFKSRYRLCRSGGRIASPGPFGWRRRLQSTDAGKTWTHLGLRDGQQIAQLAVDPNPDRFSCGRGPSLGRMQNAAFYRSLDGVKTSKKCFLATKTSARAMSKSIRAIRTLFTPRMESREAPWENGVFNGEGGGIFKSIDGGKTWRQLRKTTARYRAGKYRNAPSKPSTLFVAVRTKTIATLSIG